MKSFFKIIRNIIIFLLVLIILICSLVIFKGYSMYKSAFDEVDLDTKINSIKESTKYYVSYEDIPKDYVNAVVAVEDHRFFEHNGIDFIAVARAVVVNITHNSFAQGGSTLTQQLCKNIYFTQEQDFNRKIAEVFAASDLEKNISKEKIFELYANTSYFGNGYTGLGQASMGYFGKPPAELTLYECTLLAGIPNAPSIYAPTVNLEKCIQRQHQVISAMLKYEYIDENTADELRSEQPNF